jgi:hypothetical protein
MRLMQLTDYGGAEDADNIIEVQLTLELEDHTEF